MKTLFYTLLTYYCFFTGLLIFITVIRSYPIDTEKENLIHSFFCKKRIECIISTSIAMLCLYFFTSKMESLLPWKTVYKEDLSILTLTSIGFILTTLHMISIGFDVIISRKEKIIERMSVFEEDSDDLEESQVQ